MEFINKPQPPDVGGAGATPIEPPGPTLQEQISALQSELAAKNEQMAGLKFDIETIDSQIAQLKSQSDDGAR